MQQFGNHKYSKWRVRKIYYKSKNRRYSYLIVKYTKHLDILPLVINIIEIKTLFPTILHQFVIQCNGGR